MEKTPLGIMPRNIWQEKTISQRKLDILAAMRRYAAANMPVPTEWVEELTEIVVLDEIATTTETAVKTESDRPHPPRYKI